MMLGQLLLLYLMAGIGVATAVYLALPMDHPARRWFQLVTALVFWPLYLPILLSRKPDAHGSLAPVRPASACVDDLARVIAQVDAELEGALQSLDGWAEEVVAREKDRLHELRTAWFAQADRIRDMDRLLGRPEYAAIDEKPPTSPASNGVAERLRSSQEIVRQNVERLKQVRQRTLDDLLGTLAWVRELVSMIHLAKFTGAPASRAEELVAQIAAAVEGLSAITWQQEGLAGNWKP